ncbi:MAG: PAS domain-containing protein [Halioglobus sp.]|nr:PAS domain-containing protein [Halioglobus sp.]
MSRAQMQLDRDILDSISTGIVALDRNLCVVALNAAGEALLETSEKRSVGAHARQLLSQPSEWLEDLQQVLASSSPLVRRGMPLTLLGGQQIHVDVIVTPVPGETSSAQLLVELQPVDRLLKISREEGLIHAHETTRTVIRGLAHEIKNPLGGIRGAAQLLSRQLTSDDLCEYTTVIIREADRLRDLVDRLLGPNQQLCLQPLNIHQILEHVRHLIAAEWDNQVRFARDYDPSLPEFPADSAQLVQAILNIMRNALQAAEQPGHCHMTLRTRAQRQFTIGTTRHRLVCRVDIIDNGPGIPAELQHAVFAPMVTGRADGTGLGLSIAQSIVNRHGGLLECQSEPGNTVFTLYLPMEATHA